MDPQDPKCESRFIMLGVKCKEVFSSNVVGGLRTIVCETSGTNGELGQCRAKLVGNLGKLWKIWEMLLKFRKMSISSI